jgi:hypothetical protein
MIDFRRKRSEVLLIGRCFAGEAQPQQSASMKAVGEGNHCRAARCSAGDLNGVLHRFGPGGQEDGFLRRIARCQAVQALGQTKIGLVHRHLKAGMGKAFQLRLHRLQHFRVTMPNIHNPDAARKVDILIAIKVPELRPLRLRNEDRVHVGHAARHVLRAQLQQGWGT